MASNNLFWGFITILHTINLTAYHCNSILQNRWTQRRKEVLSSLSNSLFVLVIDYNAEGCYKDSKKKSKKIFTKKFSTVEGVDRKNPDVEMWGCHLIGMTENLFASYWCLCVSVSFILLLFHKQKTRNLTQYWGEKRKIVPFLAPSQHYPSYFFPKMSFSKP